ncbi:hypothetical protein GOP47_0029939, partial [Adiantum capillus-veneris]
DWQGKTCDHLLEYAWDTGSSEDDLDNEFCRASECLRLEDGQFIFDVAASHCVEIATHRHGCCLLQRFVDFSSSQQRNRLVVEIAANALVLSKDPFGNYVLQYILDLGLNWAFVEVLTHMDGNFVHLAMQKFSSNIVEKCLKLSREESKAQIIRELMSSARLAQLLHDPFANYVVQPTLMVSENSVALCLVFKNMGYDAIMEQWNTSLLISSRI